MTQKACARERGPEEGPPAPASRPLPLRARVEAEGCGAHSLLGESPRWLSHSHPRGAHPRGARPEEVLRSCGLMFPACG